MPDLLKIHKSATLALREAQRSARNNCRSAPVYPVATSHFCHIASALPYGGKVMSTKPTLFLSAVMLAFAAGARAQSNDIATGNMHFSVAEMDVNGDHMISKDEFMQYGEKMWSMMSKGATTITV